MHVEDAVSWYGRSLLVDMAEEEMLKWERGQSLVAEVRLSNWHSGTRDGRASVKLGRSLVFI